ncbi:MAG: cytochrome c nitrite reductase small subunit [Chloroflexota bacterium]
MGRFKTWPFGRGDSVGRCRLLLVVSAPVAVWALVTGLAGGIFGLGGFTFLYAQGYSYLGDSPQACANCHVMREAYDGWNHSSHRNIATCNGCHTPRPFVAKYTVKALHGLIDGSAFTFGNFSQTIRILPSNRRVVQENCLYCHGELADPISHGESAQPTDCLRCHARVGHQ